MASFFHRCTAAGLLLAFVLTNVGGTALHFVPGCGHHHATPRLTNAESGSSTCYESCPFHARTTQATPDAPQPAGVTFPSSLSDHSPDCSICRHLTLVVWWAPDWVLESSIGSVDVALPPAQPQLAPAVLGLALPRGPPVA